MSLVKMGRTTPHILLPALIALLALANIGCTPEPEESRTARLKRNILLMAEPGSNTSIGTVKAGSYIRAHVCDDGYTRRGDYWCYVATPGTTPPMFGWMRNIEQGGYEWTNDLPTLRRRRPIKVKGIKNFLVIRSGYGLTIAGEKHPVGSVLQVKRGSFFGSMTVIIKTGKEAEVTNVHRQVRLLEFNWDIGNDRATGKDQSNEIFKRYYHMMILAMKDAGLFLILLLTVYGAIVGYGKDSTKGGARIAFFSGLVLVLLGEIQGEHYSAYLARIDIYNDYFEAYRLRTGEFKSFVRHIDSSYSPYHSGSYTFLNYIYEGWALIEGEAKRLGRLQSVLMDRVEDHHHLQ